MTSTTSNAKAIMVAIALSMTLLGCDDAEHATLETAVKGHKIGMSVDQWLEQYSRVRQSGIRLRSFLDLATITPDAKR